MRQRRVVAASGIAAFLLATPWWGAAALRPFRFFAVRRVEVVGARYLAPGVVLDAMDLGPRASVWADLTEFEQRLRGVPGVGDARVRRRLPGTLRVVVREVEPVALAMGGGGLVAVGRDGRPLPYDPSSVPVDAPVVDRALPGLLAALAVVQTTDLGLFADISAARLVVGGEVVLELDAGRLRLLTPVEPDVVRALGAVRRDLTSRGQRWDELDARYRGWVVVRRPRAGAGNAA